MAIKKFNFLDEGGVQDLAEELLKSANSRIRERILTAISEDSYNDEAHVLSSKAILDLIGKIDNFDIEQGLEGAIDPESATILGKVKALQLAIGNVDDTADEETVYGAIQAVRETISGLTHLTYKVVTGDIETQVPTEEAKTDVIYLQHDEPAMSVGNDGYLLNAEGTHATVSGYEAFVNTETGKIYKVVEGVVSDTELLDEDPIFAEVAMVEDKTYNLYIAIPVMSGDDVTDINWLCVGDTSLDLSNYWSKTDASTKELQNRIMAPITTETIKAKVEAAYAATVPTEDSSYVD